MKQAPLRKQRIQRLQRPRGIQKAMKNYQQV